MPESKFDKIYADLKNKIETKVFSFNSFLPSENELTKIYSSSRTTIRRALSELIIRGYIQTNQGSRIRVIYEPIERNIFKIGGIESFKEAAIRNGFSYDTKVVHLEKIVADEKIATRTSFKIGDELYDVLRIRYINNKALILDKNYFLVSVAKNLTEEIAKKSIYDYLENELKIKIMTSKRKMTTELANLEDKTYLELENYNCLAIVSGRVFNSDGIQFEYTESRHRPDYFCFEDTAIRHKFNG
ncbi:MAG: UTRA domain-containing protein [Selenomonadaceae bacterium]|nr:UTRA domain-containing protein [Selenomonadaceae bacterium]